MELIAAYIDVIGSADFASANMFAKLVVLSPAVCFLVAFIGWPVAWASMTLNNVMHNRMIERRVLASINEENK
jgi:hypothetical protein